MRHYHIKHTCYLTLLLFSIGCFIYSCTKKDFKSNSTFVKKNDSTQAALDSLPSFSSPAGLVLDAAGNIYVADYGNNLIRKITPAGVVSTFAGSGTQGSFNGTGVLASFSQPSGIAIDANGNLYITDSGNDLIRMISPGGMVTTLAGGDTTVTTQGGSSNNFFDPTGIAVDAAGTVYVADAGNNQIRKIMLPDTVLSALAGDDSTNTIFNNPTGIALDPKGSIYAANYLDNNILKITQQGTVSIFAGTGQTGAANGAANAATFNLPNSVALDQAGNLYVSDGVNNLIRKISAAGTVTTLAGSGAAGAADSTGTAASFNGPAGLAVDAAGNVYVADANNNLIRKITPAGVVTTIAGNGQPGSKNGLAVAHRNKKPIKSFGRRLDIFSKRRRL